LPGSVKRQIVQGVRRCGVSASVMYLQPSVARNFLEAPCTPWRDPLSSSFVLRDLPRCHRCQNHDKFGAVLRSFHGKVYPF
jgi:hypothetical protein